MDFLVRVVAPHFVAGLIMRRGKRFARCVHAAPILRWCVGSMDYDLRPIFARNGWVATVLA